MTPNEPDILRKELSELRREIRALRRWVIFSALLLGVLLFLPKLAVFVAEATDRFLGVFTRDYHGTLGFVGPAIAIVLVALIAAAILSRNVIPGANPANDEDGKS